VIAATLRDVDRRRELLMAAVQGVLILLGMLAIILLSRAQNGMTWRTTWFLVAATTFAVVVRVWAVERFSPKAADIYARTLVLEFLPQVLEVWNTDPVVRSAWRFHEAEFRTLRSAPAEELHVALERLAQTGYRLPSSIPVVGLASKVLSAAAGVGLGIWLPTVLGGGFLVLCDFHGSPWELLLPVRLSIAVWLGIVALLAFKTWVWAHNRAQLDAARSWFRTNLRGELLGILAPRFASRREGVVRDTLWLAGVLRMTEPERRAVLETERRPSWLWRLQLSRVNERSLDWTLFLVGLWLAVALPPLFGIGCGGSSA
jgi:hypothetical protein